MSTPLERLTTFLRSQPAMPVGPAVSAGDPALAEARAIAARDPRLGELVSTLIDGNTSFCLFDLELFAALLGRGRRGEPWNQDGAVIAADELCLAKNGAGDLYVWSARTGQVRFLVHDDDWATRTRHASLDDFVVAAMDDCLERLTGDDLDAPDPEYLAMLRFALEVGDSEAISDDDVVERLQELGLR
ncbi:MAG: hypothetical protein H6709_06745 [Kofleriaceae bacterium]|nr:hypothetical protein [Myxococcales bacterium]MCB9560296.1 hypothetical protein [Kofleriaceae bacterium]MCB9571774.1 hypothetical protein [Kofleriaceae bacterium]